MIAVEVLKSAVDAERKQAFDADSAGDEAQLMEVSGCVL